MPRDDLDSKHPINRACRIVELVLADARAAISCCACFVAVNDEIRAAMDAGWSKKIANADVLDVTSHSLVSYLALRLARLFDPGRPGEALAKTDLASVPILMRYLADGEVAKHFVEEARTWTPDLPGSDEAHAKGVADALREASTVWSAFENSQEGEHALASLKLFRNRLLAHTLDKPFDDAKPAVNDLYRLTDCLVLLTRPLSLALRGEDWQPAERQRRGIERGHEFWRRAIEANRAMRWVPRRFGRRRAPDSGGEHGADRVGEELERQGCGARGERLREGGGRPWRACQHQRRRAAPHPQH